MMLADPTFDVNSELYFNEKLNVWLNGLMTSDFRVVLEKCFEVPVHFPQSRPTVYGWDSSDPARPEFGRFDQRIDFGKQFCVILELKISTEAAVGQLQKYLDYIVAAGY